MVSKSSLRFSKSDLTVSYPSIQKEQFQEYHEVYQKYFSLPAVINNLETLKLSSDIYSLVLFNFEMILVQNFMKSARE